MIEYRRRLAERDLAAAWPQWRIVRLLGTGSFGEVYEIHRQEYGRISKSALKIIRKEHAVSVPGDIYTNISRGNTSEEFITSVLKEIDIMERLKGAPNIVVIDDYTVVRSQDSNAVLIRMELLTNLGEFMTTRQITMNDIIKIGIDTCNALEYCEHQHIIHRDVKESNIFYSEVGDFKLGDFGISRQLNDYLLNSGTLTSAGTVSKMAPEVFNGQKYDHRVDIYSLGIVLYSLLNYGRPPFYPPYPEPVTAVAAGNADMIRIKGAAIPPLPGVDSKLNKIICKACNPHPSARYKNAEEFREALEEYYDFINNGGIGVQDTDGGTNSKKILAGILVASLAVIIGAISIWIGTQKTTRRPHSNPSGSVAYEQEVYDDNGSGSQSGGDEAGASGNNSDAAGKNGDTQTTENEQSDEVNSEEGEETEAEDTGAEDTDSDTYAGSSHSIKDQLSTPRKDDEAEEDENGSLYLKTRRGRRAIKIDPPDWGSKEYSSSDSIVFGETHHSLWVMYYSSASYSSNYSARMDQLHYTEDSDSRHTDYVSEVTTSTIGDYEVNWFTVKFTYVNSDGSVDFYVVKYFGSIEVSEGLLEFEDEKYENDEYPTFEESEFMDDISHWEEVNEEGEDEAESDTDE